MKAQKPSPRGAGKTREWSGPQRKRRSDNVDDSTSASFENNDIQKLKVELENQLAAKIRKEMRLELKEKERDLLEKQVRAEFIAKAKVDLDPAAILDEFSTRATRLLSDLSGLSDDQIALRQISSVLRQSILEAFRCRKLHVSQLVEMDRSVRHGITTAQLTTLVDDLLARAGVHRMMDMENFDFFINVNGGGADDDFEVVEPAYLDAATGQLLLPGQIIVKTTNISDDNDQQEQRSSEHRH
ncbi:hypothetical protein AB0J71_38190 [Nonomuraea sp. NPDC049637]|uniref:hypothetical protein n=1 Tax=Nonomuraea sp. NPDC049637 TaxID=3154356 RepID=UPI00342833E0